MPRKTRRPKKLQGLSPFWRAARATVALAVLALGSCSVLPENRYPLKSDARPHEKVAAVHALPIHGIDVSKWQGTIDWASVKAAGTKFAFIKATEGGDHIDERFLENWDAAKRVGIPRGAYHFVWWCRPAHEQAEWFKRNVPVDPDALPPVLDVEWNNHSRKCPRQIPPDDALAMTKHLLQALEAHTGKRPIVYTDINFHKDVLVGQLDDYPFWIRSTAAEPHERYDNRRWTFWQWTTTGRVPGIKGDVDRNAFYGTENQWQAFLATDCDPRDLKRFEKLGLCGK
jgi:lysozyme